MSHPKYIRKSEIFCCFMQITSIYAFLYISAMGAKGVYFCYQMKASVFSKISITRQNYNPWKDHCPPWIYSITLPQFKILQIFCYLIYIPITIYTSKIKYKKKVCHRNIQAPSLEIPERKVLALTYLITWRVPGLETVQAWSQMQKRERTKYSTFSTYIWSDLSTPFIYWLYSWIAKGCEGQAQNTLHAVSFIVCKETGLLSIHCIAKTGECLIQRKSPCSPFLAQACASNKHLGKPGKPFLLSFLKCQWGR